jgi:hypothetical protein
MISNLPLRASLGAKYLQGLARVLRSTNQTLWNDPRRLTIAIVALKF